VLTHVMDLHLALLRLAITQLDPANLPSTSTAPNSTTPLNPAPAEKITAVLRRILQSLRVASRWVTANTDYLYRSANPDKGPDALVRTMGEFWSAYATFATALDTVFGKGSIGDFGLPGTILLEEDVELDGFTPLKGSLKPQRPPGVTKAGIELLNQTHPNDEYLMRIRDILEDADALTKSKVCHSPPVLQDGIVTRHPRQVTPLKLQNGVYTSRTEVFTPTSEHSQRQESHSISPRHTEQANGHAEKPAQVPEMPLPMKATESPEDDIASVSTEDPVTLAMRATLGTSDDEFDDEQDDEQILFPQGTWNELVLSGLLYNSILTFL